MKKYRVPVTFIGHYILEYEIDATTASIAREKVYELADQESPETYLPCMDIEYTIDLDDVEVIN
jgi:hypothetical protein